MVKSKYLHHLTTPDKRNLSEGSFDPEYHKATQSDEDSVTEDDFGTPAQSVKEYSTFTGD